MEDLSKRTLNRAVVGVGGHKVFHIGPPLSADIRLSNGIPAGLIFQFDIAEQLTTLLVQKNGVGFYAVCQKGLFKLRPDRIMPFFIFSFITGVNLHDKGLANHKRYSLL